MQQASTSIIASAWQQKLLDYVVGYWLQDEWDMYNCPLVTNPKSDLPRIKFSCASPLMRLEVKYACRRKFEIGDWNPHTKSNLSRINAVLKFLCHAGGETTSLMNKSLEYWESSMRSYLTERGQWTDTIVKSLNASQEPRAYIGIDQRLSTFRQIYLILTEAYDERPEYEKDLWDLVKLGALPLKTRSATKLNFEPITQSWLRVAAKQFARYLLSIQSVSSCQSKIQAVTIFSGFLSKRHPHIEPGKINRPLLIEFFGHLVALGLKDSTRGVYIQHIRSFLDLCIQEHWLDIASDTRLIDPKDIPQERNTRPRFIPQDVLDQLNQHLHLLLPEFMRMILIIQDCGMRIDELLTMPFDCLIQDSEGDYFLRFVQGKMKKEHSIPISSEVTIIIQEQQQIVRDAGKQAAKLLFPDPKGKPFKYSTFLSNLNRLAYEQDIRDSNAALWHFELHQFRHTVGTRMINNGVPQPIIQRYLGHLSPEMTNRYAYIHDQTMKEAFAKYRGKIVNISGKVVENDTPVDATDLQWLKKNILAQALPNGYCGLPTVAGPCPHANACLTCTHFRTDSSFLREHKAQLAQTERLIAIAQERGWTRQLEMNEQVKANLSQIIIALEPTTNDA